MIAMTPVCMEICDGEVVCDWMKGDVSVAPLKLEMPRH